jgi:signal transduction histidine kinase
MSVSDPADARPGEPGRESAVRHVGQAPHRGRSEREEASQIILDAREQAGRIISAAHREAQQIMQAARDRQATLVKNPAVPGLPCRCFDELPDGVVIADDIGRITVFNPAAARLTGLSPAEVAGKFAFDVLPLYDADGQDWWVWTDPYHGLATRTRHPERLLYLADGTEVLTSVGYMRDRDPGRGGHGPGPVRRLVICLRGAQQRERLERSRAELVSTVAHELRSPLTSVKGFTATLLAKWDRFSDDQKRVMLETINADADRVTRLINDLLNVSKIESGRIEVRRELVNLPDRARRVIAGRIAVGDPADRFLLEVGGDLPETWLDADKIDQILGNLVENAVRHGAGIVTIAVEPTCLDSTAGKPRAPDAVALRVRDQGEGIAPEAWSRVFRQFWRGKRNDGTGLGLYIVKGLVEAHSGTIGVRNAPDGGAEFRLIIPAGTAPG